MGLEVAEHRDDVGVTKPRQGAGFVEKPFPAPDEIIGKARTARYHLAIRPSDGELNREVLLDGYEFGELGVEGTIGDTESTVPDDCIEPIVAEPRSERQGLIVFM